MTIEGWRETTLGEVVNIHRGMTWKREQEVTSKSENAIPVLRIPNIKQTLDTNDLLLISGVTEFHRAKYAATKNWILMVGSNGNPERVGNCIFVEEDNEYLFASFLLGIESKDHEQVDPRYLFRFIEGPLIQRSISDSVQGSTGLKNISLKMLRQESINVPPLLEQQKITAILSSVDDAIQATQAVIDQTRRVKHGLMQQLLTRGIGHTRFKQTEIGEVPENWKVIPFRNLSDIGPQNGLYKSKEAYGTGTPIIEMGVVFGSDTIEDVEVKKQRRLRLTEKEQEKFQLKKGDLLFARRSLVAEGSGKCTIMGDISEYPVFESSIIRFRLKPEMCHPKFYFYYWEGPIGKKLRMEITRQVAVSGITGKDLEKLPVPAPDIKEQIRIASVIELIDTNIKHNETNVNQLITLKRGLMQDLLTGRVRVKLDEEATT